MTVQKTIIQLMSITQSNVHGPHILYCLGINLQLSLFQLLETCGVMDNFFGITHFDS